MAEKFSLKDELFNPSKVKLIANQIKNVYPTFGQEAFENEVIVAFEKLELKERIYHIRACLGKFLPQEYQEATTILLTSLPQELDPTKNDNDFGDFIYAPYSDFVAYFGCTKEHVNFSLNALREITKRFSVEFAIRDFINHFPSESFAMLLECSQSSNYHERRLASEGTRPKLQWAKKLTVPYRDPLALLENLYHDPTRYVTRSVANHLNDISKLDAPLVIKTLKQWKSANRQNAKEMKFILFHALRSLVKEGNIDALELLGYSSNPAIVVHDFKLLKNKIKIGESLEFAFEIRANHNESLMIDYTVYFQTKSAKLSPKVYKLKKLTMQKNETLKVEKSHPFKANMSTRKLYAGEHQLCVQINGRVLFESSFTLLEPN